MLVEFQLVVFVVSSPETRYKTVEDISSNLEYRGDDFLTKLWLLTTPLLQSNRRTSMTTQTKYIQDAFAHILDNDCDPSNPYIIPLHCKEIKIYWEEIYPGRWCGECWIPRGLTITKIEVNP